MEIAEPPPAAAGPAPQRSPAARQPDQPTRHFQRPRPEHLPTKLHLVVQLANRLLPTSLQNPPPTAWRPSPKCCRVRLRLWIGDWSRGLRREGFSSLEYGRGLIPAGVGHRSGTPSLRHLLRSVCWQHPQSCTSSHRLGWRGSSPVGIRGRGARARLLGWCGATVDPADHSGLRRHRRPSETCSPQRIQPRRRLVRSTPLADRAAHRRCVHDDCHAVSSGARPSDAAAGPAAASAPPAQPRPRQTQLPQPRIASSRRSHGDGDSPTSCSEFPIDADSTLHSEVHRWHPPDRLPFCPCH